MSVPPPLTDWSALLPAVQDLLERSDSPLPAKEIRTRLPAKKKPSLGEIQALLEGAAGRGEIHRWDPVTGKTPRYWTRSPVAIAEASLVQCLSAAKEPLTADEYRKLAKIDAPTGLVTKLLDERVAEGKLRRYAPIKKNQDRYWAGEPRTYYARVILQVLAKGKGKTAAPMAWSELNKALKTALKGVSEDELSQVLQYLIDNGEAFKSLRFTATGPDKYSTRPPDLVALVGESLNEIRKKFAKAGVSAEQVDKAARTALGAATQTTTNDLPSEVRKIFAELKREEYAHTGLVPIPDVRRVIAARLGPDAARHDVLDEVIKGLVKSGALNIIPLNDATGVAIEDRNDAIPGSQETWYYLESRP